MEEIANKWHFKCTDFNFSTCVTAYSECICVCVCVYQNLLLVAKYHVDR